MSHSISSLGTFKFVVRGSTAQPPPPRDQILLTYVASRYNGVQKRELIAAFWPDSTAGRGFHSLSQALYRIARRCGRIISINGDMVQTDPDLLQLDLVAVRAFMKQANIIGVAKRVHGRFLPHVDLSFSDQLEAWRFQINRYLLTTVASALVEEADRAYVQEDWERVVAVVKPLVKLRKASSVRLKYCAAHAALSIRAGKPVDLTRATGLDEKDRATFFSFVEERQQVRAASLQRGRDAVPLIGRERDLQEIWDVLSRDESHNCLVEGPPGIGKSALARRIGDQAAARGAASVYSRCFQAEAALGFAPILNSISNSNLQAALSSLAPLLRDTLAQWTGIRPLSLATAQMPTGVEWKILVDSFACLLEAAAGDGRLIYCVDDVHWADHSTIAVLDSLSRRLQGSNVSMLLTARRLPTASGGASGGDVRLLSHESFVRRKLGPLTEESAVNLVRSFAATNDARIPRGLEDVIVDRSAGSPFVLLELCRMAGAAQSSQRPAAIKRLLQKGHSDSIVDYVQLRYSALDDTAARLLDILVVHGGRCDENDLQYLLGSTLAEIRGALGVLNRCGLVDDDDGPEYRVHHDIFREALYRLLLPSYRRSLHHRIAECLKWKRERHGLIAHHFNRSQNRSAAFRHAVRATKDCSRQYAHHEAADLYMLAAENALEPRTELRLRFRAAQQHLLAKQLGKARAQLISILNSEMEMSAHFRSDVRVHYVQSSVRIADSRDALGISFRSLSRDPEVMKDPRLSSMLYSAWLTDMVEYGGDGPAENDQPMSTMFLSHLKSRDSVQSLIDYAQVVAFQRSHAEAKELIERGIAAAAEQKEVALLVRGMSAKATISSLAGDIHGAASCYQEMLAMAEVWGEAVLPLSYWNNRGVQLLEAEQFPQALDHFRKAQSKSRRAGAPSLQVISKENQHVLWWESEGLFGEHDNAPADEAAVNQASFRPFSSLAIRGLQALETGSLAVAREIAGTLERELPPAGRILSERAYAEVLIARVGRLLRRNSGVLDRLGATAEVYKEKNRIDAMRMELEFARHVRPSDKHRAELIASEVLETAGKGGANLLKNSAERLLDRLRSG